MRLIQFTVNIFFLVYQGLFRPCGKGQRHDWCFLICFVHAQSFRRRRDIHPKQVHIHETNLFCCIVWDSHKQHQSSLEPMIHLPLERHQVWARCPRSSRWSLIWSLFTERGILLIFSQPGLHLFAAWDDIRCSEWIIFPARNFECHCVSKRVSQEAEFEIWPNKNGAPDFSKIKLSHLC